MILPAVVLVHIFSYLATASGVCYGWWKLITRGAYLREDELYKLDLSGSEDLYRFLPLKMFATLTRLNISSTRKSNKHFLQIIRAAENLENLDISNCMSLTQSSIFKAKNVFGRGLEYVDISGNQGKFTILAVACLCSCESLQTMVAHGYNFTADELQFLSRTFKSVSSGTLQLETEDGYNPIDIMSTFEEELFDELFL